MKTLRILLSLIVIGFMIMILAAYFNYSDLSWDANSSEYIALGAGLFLLLSNGISLLGESKKRSER